MNDNTLPDDPLGPPVLRQVPPVTARNQALAGRPPRRDVFAPITTTTISLHPEDS